MCVCVDVFAVSHCSDSLHHSIQVKCGADIRRAAMDHTLLGLN